MLSIIIPTLNEEKYLPRLLESIRKQKIDYEVIVADGGSTDQTLSCAKGFKGLLAKSGNPAGGRNAGAKAARGEYLLFLDADVVLPDNFLEQCLTIFKEKKLAVATCWVRPLSQDDFYKLIYLIGDLVIWLLQKVRPMANGFCIFSTRTVHNLVNGFDEALTFGEDADYVSRAAKYGGFALLSPRVGVSVRRFEKEGRIKLTLKYLYLNLRRLFGKEMRKASHYRFGHYG